MKSKMIVGLQSEKNVCPPPPVTLTTSPSLHILATGEVWSSLLPIPNCP